jgi:hypothetical protein
LSKPSKLRVFAAAALLVFVTGQALCLPHYERAHGHDHEQGGDHKPSRDHRHDGSHSGTSCAVCSFLHQAAVLEWGELPSIAAPATSEFAVLFPEAPLRQVRILSTGPRSPPASDAV